MRAKAKNDEPTTLADVTKAVLYGIGAMYDDFVVFPSQEARDACVLWVAHTWALDAFSVTPRLSVRSTQPGSGKSQVIKIAKHMVHNGKGSVNISPGVLWRLLGGPKPTLIIDEIDTVFGRNGSGSRHEILRSIINAGYTRGEMITRLQGTDGTVDFEIFGPIAMAGLGRLPETIASRSVEIEMRPRKAGDPKVRRFDLKYADAALKIVRDRAAAWSKPAVEALMYAKPTVPGENRSGEIWEPLLAIAELAGDEWGTRGRAAMKLLVTAASGKPTSLGTQLLIDIRSVTKGAERITSADLVTAILQLDASPWTPETIDETRVSRLLAEYGVRSKSMRVGGTVRRGYIVADFSDVFDRFLAVADAPLVEPAV